MSYIHPDARASYRHWWTAQVETYALYFAYRHLNIPSLSYVPRKPWPRYCYNTGRLWPWDISTSGESSFVQLGYPKKEISDAEQSRRDWRERKGFKRDRAKPGHHRFKNAGFYGKRMVRRSRRQHERECIAHERWDEITQSVQDLCRLWWD